MTAVPFQASTERETVAVERRVSGWPTLVGVLACQVILVGLLRLIGPDLPPYTAVAYVTGACVVALSVGHILFFRREAPDRFYLIILASFALRVLIGIWHFVTFIHPAYVDRPFETNFLGDYEWMNQSMSKVAETWRVDGFLAPMDPLFFVTNKNAFLTIYNAMLYWATGINVLTYAPWNALHAAYLAYIVVMLARKLDPGSRTLNWIGVLVAFQPFGMISSIFWRDTVGHAWLALALALMINSRRHLWALAIATPLAAFLCFCVREPYLLIPLIILVLLLVKERVSWQLMLVSAAAAVVAVFLANFVLALALRRADVAFGGLDLLGLPWRILRGFVGPFPWYQIAYGRDRIPGAPYMIPDFLQHIVSASVYFLVIPVVYARWKERATVDPSFFFGALLFFTGLFGLAVHSPYVVIGTAFMLPLLVWVQPERIAPMIGRMFLAFAAANLFWWASGLGAGR